MKKTKKGYYLPENLALYFKEWAKPGNDLSPHVSGAILAYMTLDAETREKLAKLACDKDVKSSLKEARGLLFEAFGKMAYADVRKELSPEQWAALLEAILQLKNTENQ